MYNMRIKKYENKKIIYTYIKKKYNYEIFKKV
jgi:hypothetical protein